MAVCNLLQHNRVYLGCKFWDYSIIRSRRTKEVLNFKERNSSNMFNDPDFFWKNFRLGTELQISGSFIYNALHTLDNMQTFYYEAECFEFLYNLSVGLERLQKIAIILLEHDTAPAQEEFEKTLITHNHIELLHRIKKKRKLNLGKQHIKFLGLLDNFYNSARYDRYNLSSVYRPPQDQRGLIQFISDELKVEIKTGLPFSTGVTAKMRKFIGKLIEKFTTQLYDIIRSEAHRVGTATYEITHNTKAFKIFIAKEFDFEKEKLMQREISLFLLKNLPNDGLKKHIDQIKSLQFGQLHTNQYFESMFNYHNDRSVIDEMEYLYEENEIKYARIEQIMAIGSETNFDLLDYIDED